MTPVTNTRGETLVEYRHLIFKAGEAAGHSFDTVGEVIGDDHAYAERTGKVGIVEWAWHECHSPETVADHLLDGHDAE